MRIRCVLALLTVLALSNISSAALRTFTINTSGSPAVGPVGTTLMFSYPNGAFSNDVVGPLELASTFSITFAGASSSSYQLDSIKHNVLANPNNNEFLFRFLGSDNSTLVMQLNAAVFRAAGSGQDLPDGVEFAARTNYFSPTNMFLRQSNPAVTIGTAVPEPSVFGFGALALTVTGLGRWARRRFFTG
jgi:hypothetical protein